MYLTAKTNFFPTYLSYEAGIRVQVNKDTVPLWQIGLRALLIGSTVATWQSWSLNSWPSDQYPKALVVWAVPHMAIMSQDVFQSSIKIKEGYTSNPNC